MRSTEYAKQEPAAAMTDQEWAKVIADMNRNARISMIWLRCAFCWLAAMPIIQMVVALR